MKYSELYIYVDKNGLENYLVFTNRENSEGFLIGVEINSFKMPVYYKGKFSNFKKINNKFSFNLMELEFSNKPIKYPFQSKLSIQKSEEIPIILRYILYFDGEKIEDKILLNRISDLYDSRADNFIFSKVEIEE